MKFVSAAVASLLLLVAVLACGLNSMDKEYERIKNSALSGDTLRDALSEFELNHSQHFSSKVDLGGYYFLTGNTDRALDYLLRAEKLVSKAPRTEETRQNTAIMYGLLGRIYLFQSQFAKAMDYAEKAVAADVETGKQYRFLQAHILTAQQKNDEALTLFYELYQTQRPSMSADDVRAFMYLLAAAGRYGDCAELVDLYFNIGPFFQGLGLFASGAYENSGQLNKSILAAFLDYEYHSAYSETDDRDFLRNIDNLEEQLRFKGTLAKSEAVLRLVRSLYDNSVLFYEPGDNAFFVEDYCVLKKKILSRSLTIVEFQRYLQLERFFTRFPVYYWNVWQAALVCSPNALANYVPALEKIILLDKNGPYAQPAWEQLTKLMGYSKE
jgi:tetratricopeptide (TPR) repeat protein